MTTVELYLEDAYTRACDTRVIRVDARGIQLERTPFYAQGGGQPGDRGSFTLRDGRRIEIATTVRDKQTGELLHVPAQSDDFGLAVGADLIAAIDWDLRYAHMRCHTWCARWCIIR